MYFSHFNALSGNVGGSPIKNSRCSRFAILVAKKLLSINGTKHYSIINGLTEKKAATSSLNCLNVLTTSRTTFSMMYLLLYNKMTVLASGDAYCASGTRDLPKSTSLNWSEISFRNAATDRLFIRCYSGRAQTNDEDDHDTEGDSVNNECLKISDNKEVEGVCKVIEELFALDRSMEAVLDECHIILSHNLVLDVLTRFCHSWKPAFRFFIWAGQKPGYSHNSETYNCMMSILGKTRQFESMVEMLEEMGRKGHLTIMTFIISIRGFAAAREMKKAVGIFELMKRYNFEANVDMFNCLLDELGKAKLGKEAHTLFDKLKDNFHPNLQTYTILLAGWCKVKNLVAASKVWNEMTDKGLKPDLVAYNIMLEGLFKGQRRSEAIKLFDLMKAKGPYPNVRSYTILIRYMCKWGKTEEALRCLDDMLGTGCKPDAAAYTCLIIGFGNDNKMDKVCGLLKEMKEKGCPPDAQTYNTLIKLKTTRKMPDDAVRIYKMMIRSGFKPTIHTFNMLMKSYFRVKNYNMGCAVWEEMRKKGCCPDDNSYAVYIAGLISNGRLGDACKSIEEMISRGMKAPELYYTKLAADLSAVGKLDIFDELAQKLRLSGKIDESDALARCADKVTRRISGRNSSQSGHIIAGHG